MSFFQTNSTPGWGSRPAASATPTVTAATKVAGEQDIEVTPGANDTVSALAFSPTADVLAVASWDTFVRIYRIDKSNAQPVQPWQQYQHEGPVLDVCFNAEGTKVISVGADKVARCFDLNTNMCAVVAQHNDTIRCVRWIRAFGGALVTGSWDKTVKLWKIEPQPTLITSIDLPERVYAMDVIGLIIIVAMAERKIMAFQCNEANGTAQQVVDQFSPLKYQTRSLAALPDGDGFALGGTEGRVAVHYFHDPPDPKDGKVKKFAFRCHRRVNADHPDVPRNETQLFPVNAIVFNAQGTFATGGGDGSISFWCKASRTRLKTFETKGTAMAPKELFKTNPNRLPVTAIAFNADASIFAYALGYDWHKGYQGATNEAHVFIHPVNPEDIKKRPPKA
ncbi:Similar to S.cerevisiae protein GLE2 (RNA export factor associated with the nuclear pore complex (NPC)) [Malassezia sympodialis ATCC 42132]|uniref:Similar to S.cerevisiae protein GLE2 (RNA export factor associated with the nuclear pore complex (NPC)) n=1 Tax=Malassezia sympodialis (strain ATCC 42132) TaxID=1230383 RepID=A0A1M8A3R1_MALS4|nr:Similar to S.cerevisiae protein GLE2 (RNA export factor associated with the nuclear pore complex (NPC)) [Malassezia sympodialis ATCC 42132]